MNLEKVVEFIFTIVILLLVGVFIIVSLIIVSVVEELARFDVSLNWRIAITVILTFNFLYLIRLIVNKFNDYHRFI